MIIGIHSYHARKKWRRDMMHNTQWQVIVTAAVPPRLHLPIRVRKAVRPHYLVLAA